MKIGHNFKPKIVDVENSCQKEKHNQILGQNKSPSININGLSRSEESYLYGKKVEPEIKSRTDCSVMQKEILAKIKQKVNAPTSIPLIVSRIALRFERIKSLLKCFFLNRS